MLDSPEFLSNAAPIAGALLCALGISILLVVTKKHHGHLTMDSEIGIQKAHVEPTPRVGGVGIYIGIVLAWLLVRDAAIKDILGIILLAGLPAIGCGLLEDVTKRIGVSSRLLATTACGVLAWLLTGIALNRLDMPWLDGLMTVTPVAVLFTAFAISGVANAINIIDGFHGLASGTVIIALLALAAISVRTHDMPLAIACLVVAAAVAGFGLVNYPWGKLFMGDGGAYFIGFALAWLAVLLPVRNPGVSAWAPLLVCAYPVIEVLYTIIRRYVHRQSPGAPDNSHLHSLVKRKLIRQKLGWVKQGIRHAAVAPVMWGFATLPASVAISDFDQPVWLAYAFIAFLLLYHVAHRYLASKDVSVLATRPGELQMHPYQPGQQKQQAHAAKSGRAAAGR